MKERWSSIMDISLMDICFILKSMVKVKRHIIVGFVLRDWLLINLKLTTMGS